jgi:DNA primase catalytic core
MLAVFSYARSPEAKQLVGEEFEKLKQRWPLLDYLRQQQWKARPSCPGSSEFVGLCPLHQESQPSFYVNADKNLFYCHGCGQGGDLIRFVQLSRDLSFRQSLAYLEQLGAPPAGSVPILKPPRSTLPADRLALLEQAAAFYQAQLDRYPEALNYLQQRGLRDPALRQQLRIGYAPGGSLRRHLMAQGYSFELLQRFGLLNSQGRDTFYGRVVFPLIQGGNIVNLYGRSLGDDFAHRFLPGPKGGLYVWEQVRQYPEVILVEGLFDYAVLWQAGFRHVTCALGTHLNAYQFRQLCDGPRIVYLTFDGDANGSGQQASQRLAHRLRARGIATHRVLLPDGHDPNSFFVQGGDAQQFQSLLQAAQP